MSDGMSDSRREERVERELSDAANILANALCTVRDAVFGYPQWVLDVINRELHEADVRLVLSPPPRPAPTTIPSNGVPRQDKARK